MQKRKINLSPRARYRVPLSESSALSRHPVFVHRSTLFLRPSSFRSPLPAAPPLRRAVTALDPAPREAATLPSPLGWKVK